MSDANLNSRAVFDSPPSTIDDFHVVLDEFWQKCPEVGITDRISFETAVIELSSNVIRHADDGRGLSCELQISCVEGTLVADLHDTGVAGGVYLAGPDTADMPDVSAESGRGLPIIHSLVHSVTYEHSNGLNRWHLMRRLGEDGAGPREQRHA